MLVALGKVQGGQRTPEYYGHKAKAEQNPKMFGRKIELAMESNDPSRFGMNKKIVFVPDSVKQNFEVGEMVAFEVFTTDVQVYNSLSPRSWERHITFAKRVVTNDLFSGKN